MNQICGTKFLNMQKHITLLLTGTLELFCGRGCYKYMGVWGFVCVCVCVGDMCAYPCVRYAIGCCHCQLLINDKAQKAQATNWKTLRFCAKKPRKSYFLMNCCKCFDVGLLCLFTWCCPSSAPEPTSSSWPRCLLSSTELLLLVPLETSWQPASLLDLRDRKRYLHKEIKKTKTEIRWTVVAFLLALYQRPCSDLFLGVNSQ